MSEWYEIKTPGRFVLIAIILLAAGFGIGWAVNNEIHSDDVCEFARDNYEIANSDEYRNLTFNLGPYTDDWEYLKDVYGKDAASAIMDARYAGTGLPGAFMAGAVIEACGEAP